MSRPELWAFLRHPPDWIYEDPAYRKLNSGQRLLLILIAGQCDEELGGGSRRGCRGMVRLQRQANISEPTRRRHIKVLVKVGFVVKVGQGGGKDLANEYAIPGSRGALDDLAVGIDTRFVTNQGGRKPDHPDRVKGAKTRKCSDQSGVSDGVSPTKSNPINLIPKPYQNDSVTLSKSTENHVGMTAPNHHQIPKEIPESHKTEILDLECGDDGQGLSHSLSLDAGEDEVVNTLVENGVSVRRARKLANRVDAGIVIEALCRCNGRSICNRGAYLSETLETILEERKLLIAKRRSQQARAYSEYRAELEKDIDAMSHEELADLFSKSESCPPEGFEPEFLRKPIWRDVLVQQLMLERE